MKYCIGFFLVCFLLIQGCASSRDVTRTGQSVGKVLRAPVDLVTAIGDGIAGKKYSPGREFTQNWQSKDTDSVFWEEDEVFFSSLQ